MTHTFKAGDAVRVIQDRIDGTSSKYDGIEAEYTNEKPGSSARETGYKYVVLLKNQTYLTVFKIELIKAKEEVINTYSIY
jgi:hypothetical protein